MEVYEDESVWRQPALLSFLPSWRGRQTTYGERAALEQVFEVSALPQPEHAPLGLPAGLQEDVEIVAQQHRAPVVVLRRGALLQQDRTLLCNSRFFV